MTKIDRRYTEKVLHRVAICAFTYDTDDLNYDLEEDVTWCTVSLERRLPSDDVEMIREVIRLLIVEPIADRRPFIWRLAELAGDV